MNQRAFTLLEVIVSMAILAIALTTLFGSQSQSLSLATEGKFNTNASLLAGLKLAELESGRLEPSAVQGDFGKDFPGYGWKMEVGDASEVMPELFRNLGGNLSGRLRRIDLTVSWGGDQYLYKLRYYFRVREVL